MSNPPTEEVESEKSISYENKFKNSVENLNFRGIMYTDVKRALPERKNMNRLSVNSNLSLSLYYLLSNGFVSSEGGSI